MIVFVNKRVYLWKQNKKPKAMTTCSRCGQSLQFPVFINGVPYGSDCAIKVMGLNQMPFWFNEKSNEDFFVQKQKNEDIQKANSERHSQSVEFTKSAWDEYYLLSNIFVRLRCEHNDWGMNFISSIASQLGFGRCLQTEESLFPTYEDAINGWKEYMGSFPYLNSRPKSIRDLSSKQQAIIDKWISI